MNVNNQLFCAGLVAIALAITGCYPAGTVYQQRSDAVIYDPFPDNSIGPEIVGGRPLGYQKPLSEPTKIQTRSSIKYQNAPGRFLRGY